MDKQFIRGVGLILFAPDKRILAIEELVDKPILEKKARMISFPMETMEKGETPEMTLGRLLYEEVFGDKSFHGVNLTVPKIIRCNHFSFCKGRVRTMLITYTARTESKFIPEPLDKDVSFYGWETIDNLMKTGRLRIEASRVFTELKEVL